MKILDLLSADLKLVPLYVFVFVGFLAGKLKVEGRSIVIILIFLITPIAFFNIGINTAVKTHYIILPFLSFFLSVTLCLSYLFISRKIWDDKIRNLAAFSAGSGNSFSFGLPIIITFFNREVVGVYTLTAMGIFAYEYTVGAYIMIRSNYDIKQSLKRVLKLPMMHTFALGLILHKLGIQIPANMKSFFDNAQGCYVALGLITIGISLSNLSSSKIDWKFVWIVLSAKFIISPLIISILVFLDLTYWHFYPKEINYAMLVLAFMPPSINTVISATMNNNSYEHAAVSVMIGVVIAMVIIPFLLFFVLQAHF